MNITLSCKKWSEHETSRPWLQPLCLMVVATAVLLCSRDGEQDNIFVLYADISKSLLTSGNWLTLSAGDHAYINKPPLVFWLSALSIKLFGPTAPTIPIRLAGIGCVFLVFRLGNRLFGPATGWLAGIVCLSTNIFFINATRFRMESVLLLGELVALTGYYYGARRWRPVIFFSGLLIAIMAKGGAGLLPILLIVIDRLFLRKKTAVDRASLSSWIAASCILAPVLAWYAYQTSVNSEYWQGLLGDALAQASVDSRWHQRLFDLFLGPLAKSYWPWLPFLLLGLGRGWLNRRADPTEREICRFLSAWFFLVLIISLYRPLGFTRYLFTALPAMSILVAHEVTRLFRWKQLPFWIAPSLAGLAVVAATAVMVLYAPGDHKFDNAISAMRTLLDSRLDSPETPVRFLTSHKKYQGDNRLSTEAWGRYYLNRKITPLYLDDLSTLPSTQLALLRRKLLHELPKDISVRPLAASEAYTLAELSPMAPLPKTDRD